MPPDLFLIGCCCVTDRIRAASTITCDAAAGPRRIPHIPSRPPEQQRQQRTKYETTSCLYTGATPVSLHINGHDRTSETPSRSRSVAGVCADSQGCYCCQLESSLSLVPSLAPKACNKASKTFENDLA